RTGPGAKVMRIISNSNSAPGSSGAASGRGVGTEESAAASGAARARATAMARRIGPYYGGTMVFPLDHFLFSEAAPLLDRYRALLEEDQALRHAEYDRPDPKRRRLRVACNDCSTPWCCNQRVAVELVEALVIYRYAAQH